MNRYIFSRKETSDSVLKCTPMYVEYSYGVTFVELLSLIIELFTETSHPCPWKWELHRGIVPREEDYFDYLPTSAALWPAVYGLEEFLTLTRENVSSFQFNDFKVSKASILHNFIIITSVMPNFFGIPSQYSNGLIIVCSATNPRQLMSTINELVPPSKQRNVFGFL